MLAFIAGVAALSPSAAPGEPPVASSLFATEARAPAAASTARVADEPPEGRRRIARVDRDVLGGLRREVISGGSGRLRLNLLHDVEYEASLERSAPTALGYTLSGPLVGVPFGRVVLVVNQGKTYGRVYTPEGNWSISTVGALQTVEPLAFEPMRCGLEAEPGAGQTATGGGAGSDVFGLDRGEDAWRRGRTPQAAVNLRAAGVEGRTPRSGSADGTGAAPWSSPLVAGEASTSGGSGASDDGDVVDVLVVYPTFVREMEGGYGPILSLIDLDIATTNEALAASGVAFRVRLAAAVEVEYDWFLEEDLSAARSGIFVSIQHWSDAMVHLANPSDGHLDEVHALRDQYAADLVQLHLGGRASANIAHNIRGPLNLAGLAYTPDEVSTDVLENFGFSIARSGDGTVVAHELGHNMGLLHDRYHDRDNEPFPYSHGYRYHISTPWHDGSEFHWGFGTIMSVFSGRAQAGPPFFLAFSNPELVHPEDPGLRLGVAGDEPSDAVDGPADAARHLNELRGVLANVRASADADPCGYRLVGDVADVPAAGGTYRLRVETQPGCAWTAKAGEWVSLTSDPEGEGGGEITYRVSANEYFQRNVEILVAGRLLARSQAGSRPVTPVCGRSWQVISFLTWHHPDYESQVNPPWDNDTPCQALNFDPDYLASFRTFHPETDNFRRVWRGLELEELRPGDFDGLTGLYEVWVQGVERIPPDAFAGLTGLRTVNLSQEEFWEEDGATLREIAPGAFRGLPGLMSIRIDGHRLRRLEAGTFEGVEGLLGLRIVQAQAGSLGLAPSVFDGLSDLQILDMHSNEINVLDARWFEGPTALRVINLPDNGIRTLPKGVFDGLSHLKSLDLTFNRIEVLDAGALDGLSSLIDLRVHDNRIAELEAGAWDDLPKLESLYLHNNRLADLPEKAFEPLARLESLILDANRLTRLEAGTFDGLARLGWLYLANNAIRHIAPGAFEGVRVKRLLDLSNNQLGTLETGAFSGLSGWALDLSHNRLGVLRVGAFRGMDVRRLDLTNNALSAFEPGVFEDFGEKGVSFNMVWAGHNLIRELSPGALRGLSLTTSFRLHANPGSPFTVAPTPVAAGVPDGAPGQPLEIALEIGSAAPFEVTASLVASGGSLSRDTLTVSSGTVRSWRNATVTPDGDGPVTVGMAGQPNLVTSVSYKDACGSGVLIGLSWPACYQGFHLAPGPPLVLYGIEDRSTSRGRAAEEIDLAEVFSYFVGTADYTVSTSDGAVAVVDVADGTLTVTPGATGTAEITVTADGAGGETLTRRFTVTVGVPSVPLVLSASNPVREGFVRVLNHSDGAGTVRITAIDDAGTRHGPVRLRLRPYGAAQFNSTDLKEGNETKRLLEGVGVGHVEGDWRLEFESDLDVEALSYVRSEDGFLTPIHDAAPVEDGVHRVATFNPASNVRQSSRLRVINPGREAAEVTVRGVDDAGDSPGGPVRFLVPAGAAREFDAPQLETGGAGLDGGLGDGEGKWRLAVDSAAPVTVMSLLENTSTGHLTNLSSAAPRPDHDGIHHVALFPAAGAAHGGQGFARVINRSREAGVVRIDAFDDAGAVHGPLELSVEAGAAAHFNSDDLELGASGKGLTGGTGAGAGDWRLELSSELDIEVLAYVRTEDGFLTAMHDTVAVRDGRRTVVLLNPGSNASQISRLRLANPLAEAARVALRATDDVGALPGGVAAYVNVPARGAVTLTAEELEAGVPDPVFEGYWVRWPLGDGRGKWRLSVVAEPEVLVQSLLESPTGHLTNLSSAPGMGAH